MANNVTMETDWGAKGAQLTGAEVQAFIKGQLQALINKDTTLQNQINALNSDMQSNNPQLQAATDGCFVTYHRKSDGYQVAVPYWKWPALEQAGETADGVLVLIDGQAPIIVAPTQSENQIHWALNEGLADEAITTFADAYLEYNGQTRTAAIMAKAEQLFGEDEDEWVNYAPGFCYAYSRLYDKGDEDHTMIGIGAGQWWLPSIGEVLTIWKHKYAINLCLSVISGASQLSEAYYWSSTEGSATHAWGLTLSDGRLNRYNKLTDSSYARAVAAFH